MTSTQRAWCVSPIASKQETMESIVLFFVGENVSNYVDVINV